MFFIFSEITSKISYGIKLDRVFFFFFISDSYMRRNMSHYAFLNMYFEQKIAKYPGFKNTEIDTKISLLSEKSIFNILQKKFLKPINFSYLE